MPELHERQSQEVLNRSFDSSQNRLRTQGQDTSNVLDGRVEVGVKVAVVTASASGATQIVAAVTGKKIRVLGIAYSVNAAVNVKWQSATTDKTGLFYHGGAGHGIVMEAAQGFLFETDSAAALNINLSGAVAVGGQLRYVEV